MKASAADFAAAYLVISALTLWVGCHSKGPTGSFPPDALSPPVGIVFSVPSGELTFFELDDCELKGTYDLGSWAVLGAAINVQGDRLLVVDDNSPRIGVFSLPGLHELSATTLGGVPADMCINSSGSLVYVITQNSNFWVYSISAQRFDTVETGQLPRRMAMRPPSATQAWVACAGSQEVIIYDLNILQPVDTLSFTSAPTAVVFSPDGNVGYVAVRSSPGRIESFDAATLAPIHSFDAGTGPFELAISSDGEHLAATDSSGAKVRIWDLPQSQQWDITVGYAPGRIRYSQQERAFYVCSRGTSRVYRISVAGDDPLLTDTLITAQGPRELILWETQQ